MKTLIIFLIVGMVFVSGCDTFESPVKQYDIQQEIEQQKEDELSKLPKASCEPFAIFPSGSTVNVAHPEGVVVFKCQIENESCFYIPPLGRLGPSINCVK